MHTQWQGAFISAGQPAATGDPATCFRREFEVAEAPVRATLRLTALGIVVAQINGVRVGSDVLAPGWTSYRHQVDVRSYDVTDLVTTGPNALVATVGEGWASGALTWENTRDNYTDRPALYAQLELEYADRTDVVATDETFRIGTGGVRANGIYAGETFDAGLEPDGWARAGFDDGDWSPAVTHEWDLTTLREPIAPPIRRQEELDPVEIRVTADGRHVVDFGQVITGWVRLSVTGEPGTTITMRHAELLTPDGGLERETNRTAEATDTYVLRGDGPETWEPQFTFHGFRYLEVEGWPGELGTADLRAVVVHSELERTGWFETSSALVTKLHANTVWSMRGNFVGVPTDCPQRDERLGWTGDLNAFSPTATYLYDVRGVLGSWLADLAAEQTETGTVPWIVPNVLKTTYTPTALWSEVAVNLPWELYQEYGDLEVLRTAYESMAAFVREVEGLLDADDLWSSGFQFGDWLDPNAPPDDPSGSRTDRFLVAQALFCRTTEQMAQTATLLGEVQDAEHFAELHVRVRNAFRREYVAASGRLVSESATAYALAIVLELLDAPQRSRAGDRLAQLVARDDYTIQTGFVGTPLLTDALSSTGHLDHAYRLLLQEKCPSFLYPLTQGATTIWERWDAVLPDGTLNSTGMTSLNHYALGAVADWLHRVVGGLQRIEPGWSRVRVAPEPGGGLTSASTAHRSRHGLVSCAWRIDADRMRLDVSIPAGTSATVVLPLHPDGQVEEVGPGEHGWEYDLPAGYGRAERHTLATTFRDVQNDPTVWPAVHDILVSYFPGIPVEAAEGIFGDQPLSELIAFAHDRSADLERDLDAALTHPAQGPAAATVPS